MPIPLLASTEPAVPGTVKTFIGNISTHILNPLIVLMFALALAYFTLGVVKFAMNAENDAMREQAKRSMLWGVIGMAIMVSVFGIISLVISSIGADPKLMDNI